MAGLSKDSQLGSKKEKKKGGFGSSPSNGTFGRKKSNGSFGKPTGNGSFGRTPPKTKLKASGFKKSTALKKNAVSKSVSKSDMISLAQSMFNRYIRERDKELMCISCGERGDVEYHAGHFLSRGSHPEYRFNEWNCQKQCAHCNVTLVGNQKAYDVNLRKRIGEERVVSLWTGRAERFGGSIEELSSIIKKYRERYEDMVGISDFTEKEVLTAIGAVKTKIRSLGIDEVIRTGRVVTHKSDSNSITVGLEAIVSLNPEIRIDTRDSEIFGFIGSELLSISY